MPTHPPPRSHTSQHNTLLHCLYLRLFSPPSPHPAPSFARWLDNREAAQRTTATTPAVPKGGRGSHTHRVYKVLRTEGERSSFEKHTHTHTRKAKRHKASVAPYHKKHARSHTSPHKRPSPSPQRHPCVHIALAAVDTTLPPPPMWHLTHVSPCLPKKKIALPSLPLLVSKRTQQGVLACFPPRLSLSFFSFFPPPPQLHNPFTSYFSVWRDRGSFTL